jgi:hypothetical protein
MMKNRKQNKQNCSKIKLYKMIKKNKLNNYRNSIMIRGYKRKKHSIQLEFKRAMCITLIRTKEKKENRTLKFLEKI